MNRAVLTVVLLGVVLLAGAAMLLRSSDPAPDIAEEAVAESRAGETPERPAAPEVRVEPESATPAPEPRRRRGSPSSAASAPAAPKTPSAPTTATLRVVSDVAGAQVFLDRKFVGATPATAEDLAPGSYQLNISAPGYDNHVETVDLKAGDREVVVNFRVVRLDAAIDVVHKHRFGSCRGRLIATPAGLRYQTDNKDDGFAAALLDLETFQVDYLNKNLRVQPKKGKRYDFTDPDGSADHLFVFHRDVDQARERLKKGERASGS